MRKNLSYTFLGICLGLIITACAMGSKSYDYPERAYSLKSWVFCRPAWGNPVIGNLCNRTRCGGKDKSCKKGEWKTTRVNVCEEKGHSFFMNGGYVVKKRN